MPRYQATDAKTEFILFDDGTLEMRVERPSQDKDGGMDFDWQAVAHFKLIDTTLPPSDFCPDFKR